MSATTHPTFYGDFIEPVPGPPLHTATPRTTPTETNESTASRKSPGAVAALASATPANRDRVVDLLRAVSIGVVVLWHWSLSITHWGGGSLRMPNPIGDVPGLWGATWVLQIMPLFFLVGGYANLAGWQSVVRSGSDSPAQMFWVKRFSRLGKPVGVYVACWAAFDLVWQLGGGRSVLGWGMVVFIPLWFLGVYAAVVAAVPLTARWHTARPVVAVVALGAGTLGADLARFSLGIDAAALVGTAFVWLFCHQLGYFWHDWTQSGGGSEPATQGWSKTRVGVAVGRASLLGRGVTLLLSGLAGLVLVTAFGPYPRSMVAVRGDDISNMFPTTFAVAVLATLQLGLVLILRGPLTRWVERQRVWRSVIAANAVAMTVFCWHMTALVVFLLAYESAGFVLADQPTAAWWLTRPVWVVGPAIPLAALVLVFARFELPRPAGSGSGRRAG